MTDPRIERLTEMVAALRQEGYNRQESIELLYARIEALEAAQQPEQIASEPQWYRLSEREPQDGDHCIYQLYPSVQHEYGIWCSTRKCFSAVHTGPFVGDPERISWRLATQLHDLSPIMEPAPPAPADGLVELIRDELGHHGTASASAVIRKVATWLRNETTDSELISRAIADRLDQEASR